MTATCTHKVPFESRCPQCHVEGMAREDELAANKPKPRKAKVCKVCKQRFVPVRDIQPTCMTYECNLIHANATHEKRRAAKEREERKERRAKLNAIATIPELKKRVQIAFNEFIRMRDFLAGHACISSGRPLDWTGNKTDAGHYRSVGAAPHLRFNEDNCHAQSKHDNQYKSGNAVDYRIGLIARIGLARVEALEADNTPRHYTRSELVELAAKYRAMTRELTK